ncbi:MAG: AEC family transporter [Caldilineaceae bacterium]
MLVTLGIQLSGMGQLRLGRDEVVGGTLRLVAGPLLAFALAPLLGLTGVERGAGIIQMSMPVAVLASLIALEHDLMPDFVTRTVLFSTIASGVTLTVVLALI